jgi:hypothetical protein
MEEKFVVYENWRVRPKKAVVHHSTCSFANRDQNISEKIEDNCLINTHHQMIDGTVTSIH